MNIVSMQIQLAMSSKIISCLDTVIWWYCDMVKLSKLALCERNQMVTSGFNPQRAINTDFDTYFVVNLKAFEWKVKLLVIWDAHVA